MLAILFTFRTLCFRVIPRSCCPRVTLRRIKLAEIHAPVRMFAATWVLPCVTHAYYINNTVAPLDKPARSRHHAGKQPILRSER
jgi:hypothetical protein